MSRVHFFKVVAHDGFINTSFFNWSEAARLFVTIVMNSLMVSLFLNAVNYTAKILFIIDFEIR
ncbi:MAG: hypothetical protein ACXVB6_16580 [Mucilaginibacter sp.]